MSFDIHLEKLFLCETYTTNRYFHSTYFQTPRLFHLLQFATCLHVLQPLCGDVFVLAYLLGRIELGLEQRAGKLANCVQR